MINTQKLEEIILQHWTEVIDKRTLLKSAKELGVAHLNLSPDTSINQISVSRFEFTQKGFLMWIEFKVNKNNYTIEALLTTTSLIYVKSN